jgi:hypothetical protein
MGLAILHVVFPAISHIQSKCEEYMKILRGIPSVPHNNAMDLNDVMKVLNPCVELAI